MEAPQGQGGSLVNPCCPGTQHRADPENTLGKGRGDGARGEWPPLGLEGVPVSLRSVRCICQALEGVRLGCGDSPSFALYPKWKLWGLKGEAFSDLFITGVKAETIKIDGSPQTLFMNI